MAVKPLYAALADDLRRDIRSGKWKVGDLLPTEKEMVQQTRLSRSTVRAAFQQLVDLGLVSRHKAIGTRVVAVPEQGSYATATASMEELIQFGLATERRILGTEYVVADFDLARRMSCRPGSKWIRMTTIRTNPDLPAQPIGWTEVYLDRKYEHILTKLEHYKGLIAGLLLEEDGIEMDEIDHVIRPLTISSDVADVLGVPPASPALEITRRYLSQGALMLITFSIHPADRFSYRIGLKRKKSIDQND